MVALHTKSDEDGVENSAAGFGPRGHGSGLRILYALGPGDVVSLYRDLVKGTEPAFQPGMAFSEQFLDWCNEHGAVARAMSCNSRRDSLVYKSHIIENRPKSPMCGQGGWKYHLGYLAYGLTVVKQAILDRPSVVIVDGGTTYWFALSLLSLMGIPVIAVLHNSLWPMGIPPQRKLSRFFLSLDGWFFRRIASATVCVSPECERQVRAVAKTLKGPVLQCRAQYRTGFLSRVEPVADSLARPFRVLFLGRVEESKGVFLILSIAERLEAEYPGQFVWKIVGSGTDSGRLADQIQQRNLRRIVEAPGRMSDERSALETFGWAHVLIVPTTRHFAEGMAMSAIEGILAGRPVVMSSVVPAAEVCGEAAVVAATDDVESFAQKLLGLAMDAQWFGRSQRATAAAQAQFYDRTFGLGNVLGRAIEAVLGPAVSQ